MNISYDAYRVFYQVARCRSFTRAAQELCSNQPNVTRTIKNLEHGLGCSLFVRSNRGVSLTAKGEKLYAHIGAAMEHTAQKAVADGEIYILNIRQPLPRRSICLLKRRDTPLSAAARALETMILQHCQGGKRHDQ